MTQITSLAQVDHEEVCRRVHDAVLAKLARGERISYRDPEYPGEIVREFPGGRRVIIEVHDDTTTTEIREIPPRKDPACLHPDYNRR